jgi:hypothetical protein
MTTTSTAPAPCWVPTARATRELNLSGDTLRRYARAGALVKGEHYRSGVHRQSGWSWELNGCRAQLERLAEERLEEQEKAPGVATTDA